ncbi:Fermitin 2 [Blomia tropicalis]|nr:Fermitin 2 [Blomia tropicalis]
MLTHSLVNDGSWELRIFVTDLKVEKRLRVKGDMHIGGVILKLVEELDVSADWSDHALWWPLRNSWLKRTRTTLDQAGIQADTQLNFTPMHKILRVQLPDLRYIDSRVDFSVNSFNAVVQLCSDLGIRYPEELSFSKPLIHAHLKQNISNLDLSPLQRQFDQIGPITQSDPSNPNTNTLTHHAKPNAYVENFTPVSQNGTLPRANNLNQSNGSSSPTPAQNFLYPVEAISPTLSTSPVTPNHEAKATLLRPKSLTEKARLNAGWLDSSLSLYEQHVREYDLLLLRFKYYNFYDLNPKLDVVRINQLYEQAKWSLISEEVECTEEEMFLLAGLQLQINILALNPDPNDQYNEVNDDVGAALDELQLTLEGGTPAYGNYGNGVTNYGGYTDIPELSGYLRFAKHKLFTLKNFKRYYFVMKDTYLKVYKGAEDRARTPPAFIINLKGCDITPDLNVTQNKYGFKIHSYDDGASEYWLRCESERQYAEWITACRLATKGRTMADASYRSEVQTTRDFLKKQQFTGSTVEPTTSNKIAINPEDYVALRFAKRGHQQVANRIHDSHGNFRSMPSLQAKLSYIRAWQALPKYGLSFFVVRFIHTKREEILGIAPNRLIRIDMNTGDAIRTWPFARMKSWNVNWEVKKLCVEFDDEKLEFECLSADCKVPHEFIGGYIFLSMRSKEHNQALNENLFHKLTSGWI